MLDKMIFSKRRGAALLSLVFVAFIILSIISVAVFNIAMQTSRVERWQIEHNEKLRLSYLAYSSANAVVEAISDDLASLGASPSSPINKQGTTSVVDDTHAMSLDIVISGDASPYLLVKTKAYNNGSQSLTVTAKYNTTTNKVVLWGNDQ